MTEVDRAAQLVDTSAFVSFEDRHLTFREDTPYAVWEAVLKQLKTAHKNIQWWIGDAIRFGERRYGETYAQALEETDYDYDSLSNMAYVAGRIEPSRRRDDVPYSTQAEVAPLEPDEQDEWLSKASPGPGESKPRMTQKQLRNEIQGKHKVIECSRCGEVYPLSEATIRTEAKPV